MMGILKLVRPPLYIDAAQSGPTSPGNGLTDTLNWQYVIIGPGNFLAPLP